MKHGLIKDIIVLHLKYGNYKIELLEEYPYLYIKELLKREGEHQIKNYYKCVNSSICINRPRTNKINDNEFYTCYCGREMQNKWKTRFKHVMSWMHKFLVEEAHLDMIKNNPKFEIFVLEEP